MIIKNVAQYIQNNVKTYPIVDYNKTYDILKQLLDSEENALSTMVNSLIAMEEYEQADNLCVKYSKSNEERESLHIRMMRKKIENSIISRNVLKLINEEYSIEEETKFFKELTRNVNSGRINMSSIILQDNSATNKKITLADILYDKIKTR